MDTNDKMTIYYFSATGNSLHAASVIASRYSQSELVKINGRNINEHPDSTMVGFVFPVYMGGVPAIIDTFLKDFPFRQDVYYFSVATYYTYKGQALSVVNKILKSKKAELSYANYIPTVGNCLKEYEVAEEKRPHILERADEVTRQIAEDISMKVLKQTAKNCSASEKLHKSAFNLFFKDTHKKFTVENTCIGCGLCAKVCPVNNILLTDKKPQWGSACEACHACIHWCPKQAVNMGKTKGRLRYHNPSVKLSNLVQ